MYKYGVNPKTYGRDLPHTTVASLSIQDFNNLIPLEVVLKPIAINKGDSDRDLLPRKVFAPDFAPIKRGTNKPVKRKTEPTYRGKLHRLEGSNLISMRQIAHTHMSEIGLHQDIAPGPLPSTSAVLFTSF